MRNRVKYWMLRDSWRSAVSHRGAWEFGDNLRCDGRQMQDVADRACGGRIRIVVMEKT